MADETTNINESETGDTTTTNNANTETIDTTSADEGDLSAMGNASDSKGDSDPQKELERLRQRLTEVNAENKKFRLKAREALEAKKVADKSVNEALEKTQQLHSTFEKKLINSELRALATNEGLIDQDAFKMVDLSQIKVAENGDVIGADKVISELKTNKPYLFKSSSSSSTHAEPDASPDIKKEDFSELSDKEYAEKFPAKWRRGYGK